MGGPPTTTTTPSRINNVSSQRGEAQSPSSAASPKRPPTSPAKPPRARPDAKPAEPTRDNSPTESSAECGATKPPENNLNRPPLDKGASDRPDNAPAGQNWTQVHRQLRLGAWPRNGGTGAVSSQERDRTLLQGRPSKRQSDRADKGRRGPSRHETPRGTNGG